jgi:hypothetical protein
MFAVSSGVQLPASIIRLRFDRPQRMKCVCEPPLVKIGTCRRVNSVPA